jgi:hypothetical protein
MNNSRPISVLIPIYKPLPGNDEQFSIDRTHSVLETRPIIFIAPNGLDVSYYSTRYNNSSYRFFPQHFFNSVQAYSSLLVTKSFYQSFTDSEFILIVQPDVYVFSDDLEWWLNSPYDYVGAPWPDGIELFVNIGVFSKVGGKRLRAVVGNGGFSLRRTKQCIALIKEYNDAAEWFRTSGSNEDLFFSIFGNISNNFVIPNELTASRFSWEINPRHYYTLNEGRLPMGTHAFRAHAPEFWSSRIPACQP